VKNWLNRQALGGWQIDGLTEWFLHETQVVRAMRVANADHSATFLRVWRIGEMAHRRLLARARQSLGVKRQAPTMG
jgi:hypothetical protein